MRAKIDAIAACAWRVCIIAVALVAVLSCSAYAKKAITRVDIANKADRTVICVQGSSSLSMMPFSGTAGRYMGFQFPCSLQAKGRTVGVHGGGIACVKYSNFRSNPPITRIVANTSMHLSYSTDWSNDKKQLTITIWKHGCKPVPDVATAKPAAKVAPVAAKAVEPVKALPVLEINAEQTAPKPLENVITPRVRLTDQGRTTPLNLRVAAGPKAAPEQPEVVTKVMGMVETAASQPAPVRVARAINIPTTLRVKPVMAKAVGDNVAPDLIIEPEKKVSVNFLGADINDVLKALSLQTGQNIVASKDVKGEITVSLSNVSLDQAMDYVAKLSGYTYTKENGTYLVAPKESIRGMSGEAGPEVETEVFALSYSSSDEVLTILERLFPDLKTSKGKDNKSSSEEDKKEELKALNFIAVSATPATMKEVKRVITQLEDSVRTHMAALVTEVYTVRYSSPRMIADSIVKIIPGVLVGPAPSSGFQLSAPSPVSTTGASGGSSGGSASSSSSDSASSSGSSKSKTEEVYGKTCQALILTGPAEQVVRAVELAARIDVKSPLVNIEAKVTSINKSGAEEIGMKWNWSDIGFFEGFTHYDKATTTAGAGENLQNIPRSHNLWDRTPFDFGATLDALVTHGNARLLAAPNLLCMEGMPGQFFVGDEVTYIQRIETTPTGQNIITETKKVGVQLSVVGDVNPDGYITLFLHPEVSTLKLSVDKGVTLPVVSRRFTDHVVRVKNGETIAIGGLIRSDEIKDMTKIPLLGDLPFLGKLFQHKSTANTETEVVMFITAKVVED